MSEAREHDAAPSGDARLDGMEEAVNRSIDADIGTLLECFQEIISLSTVRARVAWRGAAHA